METRNLLIKMLGGLEIAELGAHAAKSGLLGKKDENCRVYSSGAVDAKKGIDKLKKLLMLNAGKKKAKEMDELKAWKSET
jgi:hypothetical protein